LNTNQSAPHNNPPPAPPPSANNSNGNTTMSANSSSNNNNTLHHYNSEDHPEIDEALYSRQLYVLGHDAMRRMQASNVLIYGMSGLGVEIAKNIVLGGVKSVTIYDPQNASLDDLGTQFYLNESHLGKNRASCTQPLLAELNPYVPVKQLDSAKKLTCQDLDKYQVVVLTQSSTDEQLEFGKYCHEKGIKFIVAETRGIFGQIFCDFGKNFEVVDVDGEQPLSTMISAINNDQLGTFDYSGYYL
jgi:ubiquitin-activating enzyme E1